MLKIALPNKGQLFQPTAELLTACGYKAQKKGRSLTAIDTENGIEFYFLRAKDIPLYVEKGIIDLGITGRDFIVEAGINYPPLLELNYGHSTLRTAVPMDSGIDNLRARNQLRIATSFPNIAKDYFSEQEIEVVELSGAVEIAIKLGIADAIIDIVETGESLKQAKLEAIGEPLLKSQAVVMCHPGVESHEAVHIFKARLQGKMTADAYKMIEFDCPATRLEKATQLAPGIESPTISNLANDNWKSVKSMVEKKEANKIMDELHKIGCKGIVLSNIESVRL